MQCWSPLPDNFISRLKEIVPEKQLNNILNSFCIQKPVAFRVNTIKTTRDNLIKAMTDEGLHFTSIPWYRDAFILNEAEKGKLTNLEIYKQGYIYIQNISSMIPVLLLDIVPGEKILDICAAPGSKTSQIATLLNNQGEIVANDISRQRLYKLDAILEQQGITNFKKTIMPGEYIWKKYPNYFDKALVDVPCTMEGRIQSDDPSSFKDWSPKKIKQLSIMQKKLLRSAFYATKPGGIIVYSTCTLAPEENEEVIDWIVSEEKHAIEVESLARYNIPFSPSLSEWKGKNFDPKVKEAARVIPNDQMEGFFVTKLRRII